MGTLGVVVKCGGTVDSHEKSKRVMVPLLTFPIDGGLQPVACELTIIESRFRAAIFSNLPRSNHRQVTRRFLSGIRLYRPRARHPLSLLETDGLRFARCACESLAICTIGTRVPCDCDRHSPLVRRTHRVRPFMFFAIAIDGFWQNRAAVPSNRNRLSLRVLFK